MNQELQLLNEMELNLDWFKKNLESLKERFDDQFVAIKNQDLFSTNKQFKELLKDIKQKKENPAKILIQFVSKTPIVL